MSQSHKRKLPKATALHSVAPEVQQTLVIGLAIFLLSLVSLFIYNGVEELRHSKNNHELIRRQAIMRRHNLVRQYDRDHDKHIDQDEANFGALNSYQF